jgi:hypothetical protein
MNAQSLRRNSAGEVSVMRLSSSLVAIVVTMATWAPAAHADWPSARHDPQRSGVAEAASDITNPAVYWKVYVGGSVDPQGFLTGDVDQDGKLDILYVSGGSVVASRADGSALWRTPPRGFQTISAIDDFDGDGRTDILIGGGSQAFLLAGKDGSIEWSEDPSDFGTLGGLRVADFNRDGRPDVLAEECHCCEVKNGASGFAFSFSHASGALTATKLWTLPAATGDFYSCGVPSVIFDGNGDGAMEIAHAGVSHVYIVGSDGTLLVDSTASPALGDMVYDSDCLPSDVDGNPGDELVCVQSRVFAVDTAALRQAFVLRLNGATTPPSLQLLWQNASLADQVGGDLDYQPNAVVDLDGNGTKEFVISGMTSSNVWTTYVLDARTGGTLGAIPNARTAGTAKLAPGAQTTILTTDGRNLSGWTFDATQSPALRPLWTQPDRRPLVGVDPGLLRTVRANTQLIVPDFDHDGVGDLFTSTVSAGTILYDYSAASGPPAPIASFSFPRDVDPVGTWLVPATTRAYPQVAAAGSDGVLRVFDDRLQPTVPLKVGGYCAGGWQKSPVIASLGGAGGTQSLFVSDSRGALLRFNAQNAGLANPPKPQWSRRDCNSPSVFSGLDGERPGIVCRGAQQPVSYPTLPALSAVRGDGSLIWNVPLSGKGAIDDALPGSPDTSGVPTVLVQTADLESRATTFAFSGATGAQLWATPTTAISWGTFPFAVADWDGDGISDVVTVLNTMEAISGANGKTIASGTDFLGYGLPILQDVNGDGQLDATLQGSYVPARTLEHDLVTPTWIGPNTEPYQAGAIAGCPVGRQLVEGSTLFPSRVYMTQVAGSAAGTTSSFVLAGGKQYPDEATATAAGAYLAALSDLSLGTKLTGTGAASAVLGSSDGWLYSFDPCSGALQFALALDESVCGVAFGDTDADGHDEILASTSGGYIYDIQNEELGHCTVYDVDPPHGVPDKQVDQIVTESTLFGAWQPVTGAASYEVAVTHDPEGIISDPPWRDVGNVTSGEVDLLPLVVGQTYHFAVHAVGPQGKSVDALSPGVMVLAATGAPGPDGGTGGTGGTGGMGAPSPGPSGPAGRSSSAGCGCGVVGTTNPVGGLSLTAALGLVASLSLRRRRR